MEINLELTNELINILVDGVVRREISLDLQRQQTADGGTGFAIICTARNIGPQGAIPGLEIAVESGDLRSRLPASIVVSKDGVQIYDLFPVVNTSRGYPLISLQIQNREAAQARKPDNVRQLARSG